MRLTLKQAADYMRKGRSPAAFATLLLALKKTFDFSAERRNRIKRFVEITRAYQRGESTERIADRYNCEKTTVLRYARLAGLPKRPKHFDIDVRSAVIKDYKAERSVAEIARLHGVSPAYISKIAREEGISRYAPRPKRKRQTELHPPEGKDRAVR